MAAQLDGAGTAKMAVLEEASGQLQHIHAIVERMAVSVRASQDTRQFRSQIGRAAAPLVGLLKPQFGMIADSVISLNLLTSRGGSDQTRLRALREAVAQVRTQLEISVSRVKESHAIRDDSTADSHGETGAK
jgi:hypothetical protein